MAIQSERFVPLLPVCGHTLSFCEDPYFHGWCAQHGENPEHYRLFSYRELMRDKTAVCDWIDEIHTYEGRALA